MGKDDVQESKAAPVVTARHASNLQAEDLVNVFTGQDKTFPVTRWIQDIEDHSEIFQWTPLQTLIIARRSLSGTAALWLKSERPFKSWEELKAGLLKEFPDTVDSKTIHEMMSARKKGRSESCIDYLLVMKEIGKRGRMPDYVAIKYIIDGIIDSEVNKMMLYGVSTYPELKEKLIIYETIKDKISSSVNLNNDNNYDRRRRKEAAGSTEQKFKRRCFNCGEKNHQSSQCPNKEKGLKCFKCNNFGHISTQCPETKHGPGKSEIARSDRDRQHDCYRPIDEGGTKRTMCANFTPKLALPTSNGNDCSHDNDNQPIDSHDANFKFVYDDITKQNIKTITVNKCKTNALIDTGSDINLISQDFYVKIGEPESEETSTSFSGLGRSQVISSKRFNATVQLDGHEYNKVQFYVIKSDAMPCSVLIGQDFLKDVTTILTKGSVLIVPDGENWLRRVNCFVCDNQFVLGNITDPDVKDEVINCVKNYHPNQTKEAPLQLKIVLKDDVPVAQRPRRLSLSEQQLVDNQVSEWLENGIIRVSFSEYSSPLVLIRKKDGTTRVCVDYRPINKKMVKDEYPLPIIDDLIDKLKDARVFSVLDLKNGFFHLKVSEDSIKYTSFVTHNGQYEFLRAPFGLSICPKYFMRYVTIIFRELIAKGSLIIFIDDILIPASDEFQAVEKLKEVLAVASQYGLQINWKKARLICHQVEYLGHRIENGEVQPSQEKTEAVTRYPEPKTLKQLHSFIGLTSYFRKYVKDYALIAKPLTDLLKKNVDFVFDDVQKNAFFMLKQALTSSPVLKIFDSRLHTELHTDASAVAYSAILLQSDDTGGLHPVHYFSRKTTDAEKKYTSYELEALAIIEGVKKFRHYLFGRHFKIVTDCQAFQKTLSKKDLTTRVARWVLLLEEYDYVIEHRPGCRMKHTDALSRNPFIGAVELHLHDQISRAQMSDEGNKAIIEILKEKGYEDYRYESGLLYKGEERRLVIPKSLEMEILKRIHERGHFGKRKMIEMLEKDYYIRNINKKIDDFLLTCIPCLLATKKEGKQEGFLNCIEKESVPLHTIHCDHIGPLSQTKKQYNYILTVVDAFTKFVWLFPVKGTTSKETIDKLLIHQQTFGNPLRLISDRGAAYTSNDFKEYCEKENIQHVTITTGVPRGNGQVERIHRIIIAMLTKLCISDQSQWFKHISRVQRALNSTYQRSIDTTPFELMVGTKMKAKDDIELIDLLQQEQRESFMENREDLKQKAKEQILKVQDENCRTYNRRRKPSNQYKEGDIVAIKRTQFGAGLKLKPKYLGPYRVTKVKRHDRYDVEKIYLDTEGSQKTSASADGMKPWPEQHE